MTVIVETGVGVIGANAYADEAFVLAYLTDRNRDAAWTLAGATVQAAAVVAATDYIEFVWGLRFKGTREFEFTDLLAVASVTFSGVPVAAETFTLGDSIYTFVAALSTDTPQGNNFEVLLGIDAAANASNLFDALTADAANEGLTFQTGTVINRHATAVLDTLLDRVDLTARSPGSGGNSTVSASGLTNAVLVGFAGGIDGGSQPLSFPQAGLFDKAGVRVEGIPLKLKAAMAEYADRSRVAILAPDPQIDAVGGTIIRLKEKVGPIETETGYDPGTSGQITLRPYPAADRLLLDYITPAGAVVR